MEHPDSEWLEEVKAAIDECTSDVSEYIRAHQDDATSSGNSFTDSWVQRHLPKRDLGSDDVEEVASRIAEFSISVSEPSTIATTTLGEESRQCFRERTQTVYVLQVR